MPPFLTGGQMIDIVTLKRATFRPPPRRFEAGTPPIAGAIGLGAALDWMQALDWRAIRNHEVHLTHRLLGGLASICGVRVLGPADTRDRRGVVSFTNEGHSAEEICRHVDRHGVALRGGHHCAQPLIRGFGVEGTARASLAPYSLDRDVDVLLDGLKELARARRKPSLRSRPLRKGKGNAARH
jgi:cysteine desulfurase/selenocysteine lyase